MTSYPLLWLFFTAGFCHDGFLEFSVNNKQFVYVDTDLKWNEASALCRSYDAHLATVDSELLASNILKVLSSFSVEPFVWLGGRFIHDQWTWKLSNAPISNVSTFAPWENASEAIHKCLGVATDNFTFPQFHSDDCANERSFLCEKTKQKSLQFIEKFTYSNREYLIYEGHSSWENAVAECNKHNSHLITLTDDSEVLEISLTLAWFTHLDVSLVWVGAQKDSDSWHWITTGDGLQNEVQNSSSSQDCLVLHAKKQQFFGKNCDDGFSFVCESAPSDDDFWESFVHQSTEYTLHSLKTTWEIASEICLADNSFLAIVEDVNAANVVTANMAGAWEPLTSIWLGAKTAGENSFQWQGMFEGSKFDSSILPWIETETQNNSCLLLHRNKTSYPYFAGSSCGVAHGFLCQKDSSIPLAITFNLKTDDRNLIFHDKPENWQVAEEICERSSNRLLTVINPEEVAILKKYTSRRKIWVNGFYEDTWKWKRGNLIEANFPIVNGSFGKCLAVHLQKDNSRFYPTTCANKLPFICERNPQKEQRLRHQRTSYTIINQHQTWYEASAICHARKQTLAVTYDLNEASFLAQLTEVYGHLWLGGTKRETWIWDGLNEPFANKTDQKIGYPPWVNLEATKKDSACLLLILNDGPRFSDVSCNEVHSFVCEDTKKKHVQRISVLDQRQYIFFPTPSSWKNAMEECSDNLAFLAILSTPIIARHIAQLTYGHSEVWIGGYFDQRWKWAGSDEIVSQWEEDGLQWMDNSLDNGEACLGLNRLNPNVSLFFGESCSRKLSFVCERVVNPNDDAFYEETVPYENGDFKFFENKLNYSDARESCLAHNGILATANTHRYLDIIKQFGKKYHGVWLGAQSINSDSFWTHTRQSLSRFEELHLRKKRSEEALSIENSFSVDSHESLDFSQEDLNGSGSVPESWENEAEPESNEEDIFDIEDPNRRFARSVDQTQCLKLKENGQFLPMDCSSKQSYVCEIRERSNKIRVVTLVVQNSVYTLSSEKLTWKEAFQKCRDQFGGYLAILDDLSILSKASYDFQDLWIGGRYEDLGWRWTHVDLPLQFSDSSWTTIERLHDCLNVYRQNPDLLLFVDKDCNEKHSFVCKDVLPEKKINLTEDVGQYVIHWTPTDFMSAVKTCTENDSLFPLQITHIQALQMVNLRQGLHTFWIGAKSFDFGWTWLNGQPIEINGTGSEQCGVLFRYTENAPIILGKNCSAQLPFICEKVNTRVIQDKNLSYTFHLAKLSWNAAKFQCEKLGQQLIIPYDDLRKTIRSMTFEFGEIWFDATLSHDGAEWLWDYTGESASMNETFDTSNFANNTDYCLFINESFSPDNCSSPKSFACRGGIEDQTRSFEIGGKTFTFYPTLVTWVDANSICKANGTYLAMVTNLDQVSIDFSAVWVGGIHLTEKWTWVHTGENIDGTNLPYYYEPDGRGGRNCLSLFKLNGKNKLVDAYCNTKLPFLCEEVGHGNQPRVDRIDFEDEYLVLHNLPVTWKVANDMCTSAGQHLAFLTDDNFHHFLNLPAEYHDVWLDGRYEDDIWMWVHGDLEIQTSYNISTENGTSKLAPFLRPIRKDHNCLNMYRAPNKLQFIDRKCTDHFGFICQGLKYGKAEIRTVNLNGREYSIYSIKKNWYQANKICRSNGTYLAVLSTEEEMNLLARSHVGFVKLWVGGVLRNGSWIWDHTGEKIELSERTQGNYCAIMTRFRNHTAILHPKGCMAAYGFACEERGDQGQWHTKPLAISGRYYTLHAERATWSEAINKCKDRGQHLVVPDSKEELKILDAVDNDFHDLWIGAKSVNNLSEWVWHHTGDKFNLIDSAMIRPHRKFQCLNIYKEYNSTPILINRDCNEQHSYICESVPISTTMPQWRETKFESHNYVLFQKPMTWMQAEHQCDQINGYLAVIDTQEEADFLVNYSRVFHDLWIGGRKYPNWQWFHTGQNLENSTGIFWKHSFQGKHDCLNLYSNDASGVFIERNCEEKFSFVCEEAKFHQETKKTHFVNFNNRNFMFSNSRVDYETASQKCRDNFGYLAIVDDDELEFIGRNEFDYHDLWIGGLKEENWTWTHLNVEISNRNFINDPTRLDHDCLMFYRRDQGNFYFSDRKCDEKHSFVCKDVIDHQQIVEEVRELRGRNYLLFANVALDWFQAQAICKDYNTYLAVIDYEEEAQFIAELGFNLWLDGRYDQLSWTWNHTGQPINFPFNTTNFSPEDTNLKFCLNLYGNYKNNLLYTKRNCTEKYGVVCEGFSLNDGNIAIEYNSTKYLFVNQHLNWSDSSNYCRSRGSYLAIISTEHEALTLAEQASNAFHDVWVDGYYGKEWIYTFTGENLNVYDVEDSSSERKLRWAVESQLSGDCLNLYYSSTSEVLLVSRNCSEKHVFVCEEVVEEAKSTIVDYEGVKYTINMEPITREEAHSRCSHGYLAIIDTIEEAQFLANLGQDFHSFWLGGQYLDDRWIWDYTGDLAKKDRSLFLTYRPQPDHNCSVLYRDNKKFPWIIGRRCDEKFGYICEEESDNFDKKSMSFEYDWKNYTLHMEPLPWDQAKKYCENLGEALGRVESLELATLLLQKRDYYTFWLDGVVYEVSWKWSSIDTQLRKIDQSEINYVRIVPRNDCNCLTLFRDTTKTPLYLDEDCNQPRPFVCEKYNPSLTGNVSLITTDTKRYYVLNSVHKPWLDAWGICSANGSFLPIISDDETQKFVASLLPNWEGEIWLGARKFLGIWSWELTVEPIAIGASQVEFPVWSRLNHPDNACLGLLHHPTTVFTDLNCSRSRAFICEQGCPVLSEANGVWQREECALRVSQFDETCSIKCNAGFLVEGDDTITCTMMGWDGYIPSCIRGEDYALNFVEVLEAKFGAIFFLVDSSSSIGGGNFEKILEFVKSLATAARRLDEEVLLSLITFEVEALLEIKPEKIDICDFIRKVDGITYKSVSETVSYENALQMALDELKNLNGLLFLITDSNSAEFNSDILTRLENTTVYTLGLDSSVDTSFLKTIAASRKSWGHLSFEAFDEVTYILNRTYLYSGNLSCCMQLRNSNGVTVTPNSCTRDVSQRNAKCGITCGPNYHLQGAETLLCTSKGWQSTMDVQRPFPQCLTTERVAENFLKTLNQLEGKPVIFLLDQSSSMEEDEFIVQKTFVKYLMRTGGTYFGVIIFNSEAYVEIPLRNYDQKESICLLYDIMDSVRFNGGTTNYERALAAAENEIKNLSQAVIVIITDGETSDDVLPAEKLKSQGHIIITISIGDTKKRTFLKMVSTSPNGSPMLFSLRSFQNLATINSYILDRSLKNESFYCCKIPDSLEMEHPKNFLTKNDHLELSCHPGYSLSVKNSTLVCTEHGLNINPTCFAMPEKIAEHLFKKFTHLLNDTNHDVSKRQAVVFVIDLPERVTSGMVQQSISFVKSVASILWLSQMRTVGLLVGQEQGASFLIQPNVSSSDEFAKLLSNITIDSSSLYKPMKFILESVQRPDLRLLTIVVTGRVQISRATLKVVHKIVASSDNSIFVLNVGGSIDPQTWEVIVGKDKKATMSGLHHFTVDSFETLEAVAEILNME